MRSTHFQYSKSARSIPQSSCLVSYILISKVIVGIVFHHSVILKIVLSITCLFSENIECMWKTSFDFVSIHSCLSNKGQFLTIWHLKMQVKTLCIVFYANSKILILKQLKCKESFWMQSICLIHCFKNILEHIAFTFQKLRQLRICMGSLMIIIVNDYYILRVYQCQIQHFTE